MRITWNELKEELDKILTEKQKNLPIGLMSSAFDFYRTNEKLSVDARIFIDVNSTEYVSIKVLGEKE